MALACDVIVASETTRFSQIQKKIALPPDAGGAWLLTRHLGIAKAKDLAFSARMVGAQEALQLGFVAKVVPDAALIDEALALAREYAASPTIALGLAKRMFDVAPTLTLDEFMDLEGSMLPLAVQAEDFKEGTQRVQGEARGELHRALMDAIAAPTSSTGAISPRAASCCSAVAASGAFVFYPRVAEPRTGATDLEWVEACGPRHGLLDDHRAPEAAGARLQRRADRSRRRPAHDEPRGRHRAGRREDRHGGAREDRRRGRCAAGRVRGAASPLPE